jgi:hypothetical protein
VEEVGPSESVSEDQKGGLSGRFGDFRLSVRSEQG